MRLKRSNPHGPGWTRRRAGRGFSYRDQEGRPLTPEQASRCRALVIPPAWSEVWICPEPNGHIQAMGTDVAGRRQYLYHPAWRIKRDRAKYERVIGLGRALPQARRRVARDLAQEGMPLTRALAVGFRIVDLGGVRMGGEAYARSAGTFGVATLRREHVRVRGDRVRLSFPGKGRKLHDIVLDDPDLADAVRVLVRRRSGGPELLAWRDGRGPWQDVTSAALNEYIREVTGQEVTAKDFRTWQAAVLALASLTGERPTARRTTRRAVAQAMREVADHLGNTPTVARASYVDPRVILRFESGELDSVSIEGTEAKNVEERLVDLLS